MQYIGSNFCRRRRRSLCGSIMGRPCGAKLSYSSLPEVGTCAENLEIGARTAKISKSRGRIAFCLIHSPPLDSA